MKTWITTLVLAGMICGCSKQEGSMGASDEDSASSRGAGADAADNTAQNQGDREGGLTPMDQGANETDRAITQALRKSIVIEPGKDEHSFSAKNIKIITQDGVVTLRGVVNSEQEKMDLEARAKAVPGVSQVDNLLEVKK